MIINNKKEIELTKEEQEKLYWDNLNFDSHRWVEYDNINNYYKCSFCGITHTSSTPIGNKDLCERNPFIIKNYIKYLAGFHEWIEKNHYHFTTYLRDMTLYMPVAGKNGVVRHRWKQENNSIKFTTKELFIEYLESINK